MLRHCLLLFVCCAALKSASVPSDVLRSARLRGEPAQPYAIRICGVSSALRATRRRAANHRAAHGRYVTWAVTGEVSGNGKCSHAPRIVVRGCAYNRSQPAPTGDGGDSPTRRQNRTMTTLRETSTDSVYQQLRAKILSNEFRPYLSSSDRSRPPDTRFEPSSF